MRILALVLPLLVGCGFSTAGGALGLVDFSASGCGAALAGLLGCDLRLPLALGARVDLAAQQRSDGRPLSLRSGDAKVLTVTMQGGVATVTGAGPGNADLWAHRDGQDVDRLPMIVAPVVQFAYSKLSDPSGAFTPTPEGEADGEFQVRAGLKTFGLVLSMLGTSGTQLLGRDGATYTLPPGLALAEGRGAPSALHFEFQRPAPGSYPFELKARAGTAAVKILIVVGEER